MGGNAPSARYGHQGSERHGQMWEPPVEIFHAFVGARFLEQRLHVLVTVIRLQPPAYLLRTLQSGQGLGGVGRTLDVVAAELVGVAVAELRVHESQGVRVGVLAEGAQGHAAKQFDGGHAHNQQHHEGKPNAETVDATATAPTATDWPARGAHRYDDDAAAKQDESQRHQHEELRERRVRRIWLRHVDERVRKIEKRVQKGSTCLDASFDLVQLLPNVLNYRNGIALARVEHHLDSLLRRDQLLLRICHVLTGCCGVVANALHVLLHGTYANLLVEGADGPESDHASGDQQQRQETCASHGLG
mmetsp:Transcript_102481/g.313352  ORF Transcript_102481/g.313352 Transcript_102481/m.313352 type:complete len:303 (-) Transcript_102481:271-1179(-)